jgi:uncharacterized ferritin-like protein (DUF455 family)
MKFMIQIAFEAYIAQDPLEKCQKTALAFQLFKELNGPFQMSVNEPFPEPGRPEHPELVHPRHLKKRGLGTEQGRAALWHAIAHIEFNAINLALDAFLRFPDLPHEYYEDWLRVAAEEAYHFGLINDHLKTLNCPYGSFPAHNSLWEMAEKTIHDPLVRMALVPRVMEARGLDVTPGIMQKLSLAGDEQAENILGIILRDEIGHVAVGNRWFKYLCAQKGLSPLETFEQLADSLLHTQLKGPYDRELRQKAGFDLAELDWLETHYP